MVLPERGPLIEGSIHTKGAFHTEGALHAKEACMYIEHIKSVDLVSN